MSKRLIYEEDAIDALNGNITVTGEENTKAVQEYIRSVSLKIHDLPSAQPQLDTCPIYGGMCGYPSNLCYECPRHEGAKERPQWWTEGLQPFAQPERKKDIIQKFHDYQVEWLTSHCDLELEPVLESWVVRFLHDTANCYMMEVKHD